MLSRSEYMQLNIQTKLKCWIDDDGLPDDWDAGLMRKVCAEALAEIEHLRKLAGTVSQGDDLHDIKNRVHPGRSKGSPGTNPKDA